MKVQLGTFPTPNHKYLPYSVAVLASAAQKDPLCGHVEFLDFLYKYGQYPDPIADVLGLTAFLWSQSYVDEISKKYKEQRPDGIVIIGGPNVPVDADLWTEYEQQRPWVDHFVAGPGETIFMDFLRNPLDFPKWNSRPDKKRKHINPTPYTDGLFDKILENDSNLYACIENNRGCPFKCSFCDWGGSTNSVVTRFDQNDIYRTLDIIFSNPSISGIRILDANFGMYETDLHMAKYIAEHKRPEQHVVVSGLAKNTVKYVPEITKIFWDNNFQNEATREMLNIGVQTWTQQALDNVDRKNISKHKISELMQYYNKHKLPYNSEHIIGLPGETPQSWLASIQKDFEIGSSRQTAYPLEVVVNMPLYSAEHRSRFELKIDTVYFPQDYIYLKLDQFHKDPAFNVESTAMFSEQRVFSTYSYDVWDLRTMYDYSWWMNTFFNTGLLEVNCPYDNILEFFENIHTRPFWKKIVNQHRSNWAEAYIDKQISTAQGFFYWKKSLYRTNELWLAYRNREQAEDELGKKLNFDNWDANPTGLYRHGVST
jgi:radical SAM superfamily enzyme YgiQ (UPF0313 family)